jgi:hypothetical protein
MKIIRAISLTIAMLVPVAAIASPTVRATSCCPGLCCHAGCPFCPANAHHS